MLALLYKITSVYINIRSCRREQVKDEFPLQERIFISTGTQTKLIHLVICSIPV